MALFAALIALIFRGRATPSDLLHDGNSNRNGLYRAALFNDNCVGAESVHGCASFMRSANGHFLHVRYLRSVRDEPKALVFLFHGWAEHLARHRALIQELRADFDVVALDWQGHGFSSGDVAFDVDDLADDAAQLIATVREQRATAHRSDLKTFVFAHSMGGLVVSNMLLRLQARLQVDAVALSAPLLFPDPEKAKPILVAIADVLATLLPNLPVVSPVTEDISDSVDIRHAYDADPLVFHSGLPARTAASFLRTIAYVDANAASFNRPLLIVHGTDDRICKLKGSQDFIAKVTSADKTLRVIEGAWHESLWDAKVRAIVVQWFLKHL